MKRLVFAIRLVLVLLALRSAVAFEIAHDGKPVAVIVTNGHTAPAPELAANHVRQGHIKSPADTLREYLRQMTGAELPLVAGLGDAAGRPAIVLELADRVPGASDRPTAAQAYRIRTADNRLVLTAATPLGLHNAVYGLLEDHLGCRFYTFTKKGLHYGGPGFEIVPKQPSLSLPAIDDLQEPAFANRGIIFWMGSYPWILQNRGIGLPADAVSGSLSAGHNMYDLLPPNDKKDRQGAVAVKGLFAEHPEFYPMNREGKREATWAMGICGTARELPNFLAQGLAEQIERRVKQAGGKPDWSQPFSAAQGDGFSGCQCEACRKLVREEHSEAAPLILALNRTLEILGAKYPEARVITFAYFETLDAPRTLRPHPNLWIDVVSSARSQNMAGDQVGPIVDNPANRDYARALKEWPRIAPGRVAVWHWDTYRAEWPSVFYWAGDMRYMRDCGVYGVNPQYCGGPWQDLLAWLHLKLAWNPDADADRLIRQFCDDNYGKEAGAHVWDYLQLARRGCERSLHVPSAVRWSGWTPVTRLKMFPPELLAKMTEAMDLATAAAEKAGDPARLANMIAARGQSLDVVNIDAAANNGRPWGPVRCAADGKDWFVTGADPLVPPALLRARKGIVMDGGGEQGVLRTIAGQAARSGGPLVELRGKAMTAAVCPDLAGRVVSARPTGGKELLALQGSQTGYADLFPRVSAQIWLPVAQNRDLARRANDDWSTVWSDYSNPSKDVLETDAVLSPSFYGFYPTQYVRRTVAVTDPGLRIERRFVQEKAQHTLASPFRFSTCWLLALPEPKLARVAVKGGGIDQLLDLRYAVPGGITGVKAGEKLPGADYMDERFDTVIAVSDAEPTRLSLRAGAGGELTVLLDRGDGTAAVLTTPVAGWEAIEIKPVVDQQYLQVDLVGSPEPMSGEPRTVELPWQLLSARAVPSRAAPPAGPVSAAADAAKPRIRITGPTSAVNEIDGAELVWIPAGPFLRGNPVGTGGGDEQPQKTVHLDGYWIYKHPVTVGQYEQFCRATGTTFKPTWGQGMHAAPAGDDASYAVQASWYEAQKYARWAAAALPTEAQWEKAARGTDGRRYPWGNDWAPDKCVSMENTLYAFNPGFRPVGSFPAGASPYGVQDMAGNVWEWVADWYAYDANATGPDRNPSGPERGSHKVLRGGCALYDERFSTTTARMVMPPHVRDWTPTGFRCVIAAPGPEK